MDRATANNIKGDIVDALSPFNPNVKYVKPQHNKNGYFEVSVDDYYSNVDIIDDALIRVCREYTLFIDNDSNADFDLVASWDV